MKNDYRGDWRDLLRQIELDPDYPPTPTAEVDLDAFEKAHGFALPKSYRDFAIVFGPGSFWRVDLHIRCPGCSDLGHKGDLDAFNTYYHEAASEADEYAADPEKWRRIFYFGFREERAFGWDPLEITDAANSELQIYEELEYEVTPVAASFLEFLTEYIPETYSPLTAFCAAAIYPE